MAEDDSEKSEAPTDRRRQRAREEGQVAVSREVAGLLSLVFAGGMMFALWPAVGARGFAAGGNLLAEAGTLPVDGPAIARLLRGIAGITALVLLPVLLAANAGSIAASIAQSGVVLHAKGLMPQFSRIDPRNGLARLISPNNLFEQGKSLAKLVLFAFAVARVMRDAVPALARAIETGDQALLPLLARVLWAALLSLLGIQFVIAALDIFWVRMRFTRSIRMSRQDLKDEQKESDGDPHTRARIRSIRRRRARQRMMAAVPSSTVVLTNPTHYAVALRYEKGSAGAPKIVAKGADEVAARIRTLAREHRVPLVANPPLARALYLVPLDAEVPNEHFRAVAAVIAYVWKLAERTPGIR